MRVFSLARPTLSCTPIGVTRAGNIEMLTDMEARDEREAKEKTMVA